MFAINTRLSTAVPHALQTIGYVLALPFALPFLPFIAVAWLLHWAVDDVSQRTARMESAKDIVPVRHAIRLRNTDSFQGTRSIACGQTR